VFMAGRTYMEKVRFRIGVKTDEVSVLSLCLLTSALHTDSLSMQQLQTDSHRD